MARIVVIGPYAKSLLSFRGELMKEFVHRGHEVFAVAPEAGFEKDLASIGVKYIAVPLQRAAINPFGDFFYILSIMRLLKRLKADVVFNYAIKPVIYGSLAAQVSKIKNVYSMITGLGYVFTGDTFFQQILRKFVNIMYRAALKRNTCIFFQNPDDLSVFISLGIIEKNRAVLINGSGVDVVMYTPTSIPKEPVSFLLIARLIKDKGILEFVEAARILKAKYPKAVFRLLGPLDPNPSAIKEAELEEWVGQGVIEYLGEKADVRPYLAESSVYVLPSYREGTPRSVLEAMSMGRPIVTTDAPGCRETVVHGENGLLVPVKDSKKLAEAMESFILEPNLILSMGQKSRQLALDKYDVRKVNQVILQAMSLEEL